MISVPVVFRLFALLIFLCINFSVHADEDKKTTILSVSPSSIALERGKTSTLKVSASSGGISVKSNNQSVVKASYKDHKVSVKGLKEGKTTITIKDKKNSQEIPVIVFSSGGDSAGGAGTDQGLLVSPSKVSMSIGAMTQLSVVNASGTVLVESGERSVVKAVYANNKVTLTGLKAGSTTVTVRDTKTSKEIPVSVVKNSEPPPPVTQGDFTVLAWNDLGMHCVDGKDYSVFSILPPYNNLHAHLINKNGTLVNQGVILTYQSFADNTGSINTISSTKTNFWDYVLALFGASPAPDVGLNLSGNPGNPTPSNSAMPMNYNSAMNWFEAEGLPMTPVDDFGRKNFYPMVEIVASDLTTGKELARTQTVLPVSDEMTCKACHSSTTDTSNPATIAARPLGGWEFDIDPEKDWKRNILKLHDEQQLGSTLFDQALTQNNYSTAGLVAAVDNGQPILCAACHATNALGAAGVTGIPPLTQVLHSHHATVKAPDTQLALNDSDNRTSCYMCHPGAVTQCLRGAMGKAIDNNGDSLMSCQNCHGNMQQVGSAKRQGWFNEPTCQSCHHDGVREISGVDANGVAKVWADKTFASNANTPAPGLDLFRFSKGHGDLQCEACHGATHAIYPSADVSDNVQSIAVQGHAGTVNECSACHTTVPLTVTGGPHGMHAMGNAWIDKHGDSAEKNGAADCAYCHGADFRGSPLSEIKMDKIFDVEHGAKSFTSGHQVGCYDCHNGPNP